MVMSKEDCIRVCKENRDDLQYKLDKQGKRFSPKTKRNMKGGIQFLNDLIGHLSE